MSKKTQDDAAQVDQSAGEAVEAQEPVTKVDPPAPVVTFEAIAVQLLRDLIASTSDAQRADITARAVEAAKALS